MKLHKKIVFSFLIFLFAINIHAETLTIETDGFSIISSKLNQSRQAAINDAIIKGIKKFLKDRGINPNKDIIIKIKKNAVSGYEILKESVEGNILKEKINLMLDENSLKDIIETKAKVPFIVGISCFFNGEFSPQLIDFLKKMLKDEFDYNFTFIELKSLNNITDDFDIIIKFDINLYKLKRLISINKTFYKMNGNILIYKKGFNLVDNLTFSRDLTLSSDQEYLKFLLKIVFPIFKKNLPEIVAHLNKSVENKNKVIFFVLMKPPNYSIIEKIKKIFEEFNLDYTILQVYKGNITFKLNGISKDELIKILKSKNFTENFKISPKGG